MSSYTSHCSDKYDYENDLYTPIEESELSRRITSSLVSHIDIDAVTETKHTNILASEASFPSTGQGIELAQAKATTGASIICFYKSGAKASSSLRLITDRVVGYTDMSDYSPSFKPRTRSTCRA